MYFLHITAARAKFRAREMDGREIRRKEGKKRGLKLGAAERPGRETDVVPERNESFHKFHPALTSIFLVNLTCLRTR